MLLKTPKIITKKEILYDRQLMVFLLPFSATIESPQIDLFCCVLEKQRLGGCYCEFNGFAK